MSDKLCHIGLNDENVKFFTSLTNQNILKLRSSATMPSILNKYKWVSEKMSDSNKKQRGGFISNAFGVAKKLSSTGLNIANHIAPGTVVKLTQKPSDENVINGSAREKNSFEKKNYDNPQQMMREHLPKVSSQLLGRHYKKINNVASFISPDLNDKLSDYFFDKLNDFVSQLSSVEALLKEVGAKSLEELAKDPERSQRISMALSNQNKIIAALQGTLTGATGVIGSAIDVPTSLALALRSIYQTGRAYGFELNVNDHDIVEYIFKQIDLGSIAEKHALLAALRTFANVMQTHNVNQLQQLLGSNNDAELIKRFIANEDGSFKWAWLDHLPKFGFLNKLTPFASVGISAVYSVNLVDEATDKAQVVFNGARQYLLKHPEEDIDALSAYEKSLQKLTQIEPLLLTDNKITDVKVESVAAEPVVDRIVQSKDASDQKVLDEKDTEAIVKSAAKTVVKAKNTSSKPTVTKTAESKSDQVKLTPAKTTQVTATQAKTTATKATSAKAIPAKVSKARTVKKPNPDTNVTNEQKTQQNLLEVTKQKEQGK